MTFVITQPCIDTMDQSCVEVCPVDCIHFEEGADRMLYINPTECIDCGACQPACPVSAIFPEADVPADQRLFTDANSRWYEDAPAARAAVAGMPAVGGAPVAAAAAAAPAASAAAAATAAGAPPPPGAASAPTPMLEKATPTREELGGYKYGESGVEGKCALCGTYVVKGGTKFRLKSVLCPECTERQARIGDPYHRVPGRR